MPLRAIPGIVVAPRQFSLGGRAAAVFGATPALVAGVPTVSLDALGKHGTRQPAFDKALSAGSIGRIIRSPSLFHGISGLPTSST
jgi:hypothetical protein